MKPEPAPRAGMPCSGPPPGGGSPKRRKKSSNGSSAVSPPDPSDFRGCWLTSTFTTALPYCSTSAVKSGSAAAAPGARVGTMLDCAGSDCDAAVDCGGWSAPEPSEQALSVAHSAAKRTESEVFMANDSAVRTSDITGFNGCGPA